jgi:acyl-CoA thioester hydrolase
MAEAGKRRYNDGVSAQVFRHPYRVVYADCTVGNHIYYSRYLELLEAARGEFFRHLNIPLLELQGQDTLFPVVECHLRYKFPARYDDVLTIELWITLVQGARLNFGFRILKGEQTLILEGETFHVCTGLNEKPKRIPEALVTKFRVHSPEAPAQSRNAKLKTVD